MNDSTLPREENCPKCSEVVLIQSYNPDACPKCGHTYLFKNIQGFEGAESSSGPHDGICWGR